MAISVEQLAARYGRPVDEVMDVCRRSGILVWGASTPLNDQEVATVATKLGLDTTAPGVGSLPPPPATPGMPHPQGPPLTTPPTPAEKHGGGRQILVGLAVVVGLAVGSVAVTNLLGDTADGQGVASTTEAGVSGFTGEWEPFEVDGQFLVDMPGEPELLSQEVTTAMGDVTVEMYQALDVDGGVTVAVTPTGALPADAIGPTLAGSIAGAAEGIGGTVVSDQPTDVDGYPARNAEITATSEGRSMVVFTRVAFHGDRLIQLQSLGLDENRDVVLADFDRLVATFTPVAA